MKVYRIPALVRTLIFDIDSTLYTNPEYVFEQVDSQIRRFAELRGMSADAARKLIGGWRQKWSAEHGGASISLGNTLVAFGVPIEESVEWRRTLLEPSRFLKRDDRLAATLAVLKESYSLVCVTNNPVLTTRRTLAALGVDTIITSVIGLDTCHKSKPAREPFLLAAERTAARANECVSVGDRYDIDISLPLELGMGVILVCGVRDVYELPSVLRNQK